MNKQNKYISYECTTTFYTTTSTTTTNNFYMNASIDVERILSQLSQLLARYCE